MGVALFLNGSLIGKPGFKISQTKKQLNIYLFMFSCYQTGLSFGDRPGSQPIGIILTVLGVVVLDFSADAAEGPIRAYLLDVADTEEQDMALNIHAFSAGKTHSFVMYNLRGKHTQGKSNGYKLYFLI